MVSRIRIWLRILILPFFTPSCEISFKNLTNSSLLQTQQVLEKWKNLKISTHLCLLIKQKFTTFFHHLYFTERSGSRFLIRDSDFHLEGPDPDPKLIGYGTLNCIPRFFIFHLNLFAIFLECKPLHLR